MPDRHSLSGLRLITVSNISVGAGSVAVAARPALRHGWQRLGLWAAVSVQAYERRRGQCFLRQATDCGRDVLEALCRDAQEEQGSSAEPKTNLASSNRLEGGALTQRSPWIRFGGRGATPLRRAIPDSLKGPGRLGSRASRDPSQRGHTCGSPGNKSPAAQEPAGRNHCRVWLAPPFRCHPLDKGPP
jgi:hypothetical protein